MLKLSDQVRSTHNQDGAVVLNIRQGEMFRLNLVASMMFELLKQGRTEAQIVEEISRDFGTVREIVENDVREFLVHLEKLNLLEPRTPETQAAL